MTYLKLTDSRVLVTGGAGFIGSNLCEELLANCNEVVCLDNFSTGRWENIENFKKHQNFHLIEGDIRDLAICKKAMDGLNFELPFVFFASIQQHFKTYFITKIIFKIKAFLQ